MKNIKNTATGSFIVCACIAVYTFITYFYGCIWKRIFGIPCLGCGYTRALIALLKLDFHLAFCFHPLVFLCPLFLNLFFYGGKIFKETRSNVLFWGYVALLFLSVWVIRLVTNTTV